MVNPIESLSEDELLELVERLTDYAYCKLVHLRWRGLSIKRGGSIPGGVEPGDLALQAIVDLIDGTRCWDREKNKDLLGFLKGVIDSQVSNLVNRAENRQSRWMTEPADGHDGPEFEVSQPGFTPYETVANKEAMEKFRAAIVKEIGDDPLVMSIFECLEADITKPAEMALLLEKDVSEINNAQKRLRNKVTKVRRKMGEHEGHEQHQPVRR
jgi:hypothetical protein